MNKPSKRRFLILTVVLFIAVGMLLPSLFVGSHTQVVSVQAREGTPTPTTGKTRTPITLQKTEETETAKATATPTAMPITNDILYALQQTLQGIYEDVSPSVVNIQVVQRHSASMDNNNFEFDMPDMPDMPDFHFFTPPSEDYYTQGAGSGFIWDTKGHIVTNNHVVENADRITITFFDGSTADAELVGADPDSDLAVVKVDVPASTLNPIEVIDTSEIKVGHLVVAIGNPFGLEGTMTVGFVSALGRSLPVETMGTGPSYTIPDIIQTDASINPGNSGGALVNDKGQLIGVPSAIQSPVRASAGVGFAIPSSIVLQVVPVLIEAGQYQHSWLGITGTSLTADIAEAMDLPANQRGALVIELAENGPSDKAGLKGSDEEVKIDGQTFRVGGDVIVAFDGRPVKDFDDIVAYLARYTRVNQKVELTVLRNGKEKDITVRLGLRPNSNAPIESVRSVSTDAWLGIEGQSITADIAKEMDLKATQDGVLIVKVMNDSPADDAGLRGCFKTATINDEEVLVGGDVIVAAGKTAIDTLGDLEEVLQENEAGDRVTFTILRDGEEMDVTVKLGENPETDE